MTATVEDWNARYRQIGSEHNLSDMTPTEYENLIIAEITDLCDDDIEHAISIFTSPQNEGGWMQGDVLTRLKNTTP
jgi:hypothetical protein